MLKRTGSTHARRCRSCVAEALKSPDFDTRLAAVRLSMHPDIKLQTELTPLLSASEPELRGAALFAMSVGGGGESTISDEELFRRLHDSDAGVRKICRDALVEPRPQRRGDFARPAAHRTRTPASV